MMISSIAQIFAFVAGKISQEGKRQKAMGLAPRGNVALGAKINTLRGDGVLALAYPSVRRGSGDGRGWLWLVSTGRGGRAFTLIELLVVMSLIGLMVGILLPVLGAARLRARQLQNNTQVRGIHQGMNIHAQGNKTKTSEGKYAGLDENGQILASSEAPSNAIAADGAHPAVRYAILLDGNYFTGDYAIAPIEQSKAGWSGGTVTSKNYSYAMSRLDMNGPRRREWAETVNSRAIVIVDRNDGGWSGDGGDFWGYRTSSIWTSTPPDFSHNWRGAMGWNDNHVVFSNSDHADTRYANHANTNDGIFRRHGSASVKNYDAYMVYSDSTHSTFQH